MNTFYKYGSHRYTFPTWYWLWLWIFPTYVNLGENKVVYYKNVRGVIYITNIETAPWIKEG